MNIGSRISRLERAGSAAGGGEACPACHGVRIAVLDAPVGADDDGEPTSAELREAGRCQGCGRPAGLIISVPACGSRRPR